MSFKLLERHIRLMMNEELKKANISLARSKTLQPGDFVLYYGSLAYVSNVTGKFINIHTNEGSRRELANLFRKYIF